MLSRNNIGRLVIVSLLSSTIFAKFAPVLFFDFVFYVLAGTDAWSLEDQKTMFMLNFVLILLLLITYIVGIYRSNLKWWMVLLAMTISPIVLAYIYSLFL